MVSLTSEVETFIFAINVCVVMKHYGENNQFYIIPSVSLSFYFVAVLPN